VKLSERLAIKMTDKIWKLIYIAVGAGVIASYIPAREHMANQSAWAWIIQSDTTFNFILIFFIWGVFSDKIAKEKHWGTNSKKCWIFFFTGIISLVMIFKLIGGMPTRW
jgi:hypothetical protein